MSPRYLFSSSVVSFTFFSLSPQFKSLQFGVPSSVHSLKVFQFTSFHEHQLLTTAASSKVDMNDIRGDFLYYIFIVHYESPLFAIGDSIFLAIQWYCFPQLVQRPVFAIILPDCMAFVGIRFHILSTAPLCPFTQLSMSFWRLAGIIICYSNLCVVCEHIQIVMSQPRSLIKRINKIADF